VAEVIQHETLFQLGAEPEPLLAESEQFGLLELAQEGFHGFD